MNDDDVSTLAMPLRAHLEAKASDASNIGRFAKAAHALGMILPGMLPDLGHRTLLFCDAGN